MAFVVDSKETVDGMKGLDFPCVYFEKWDDSFKQCFSGLDVYIFARKAEAVKKKVEGIAKAVYVGDPTALAAAVERGDAAEVGMLAQAAIDKDDVFKSFGFYSVPDLTEEEKKPPEFIIDGLLPCGMTVLSGAPKIRKSFFALQLAIAVASGQDFFGMRVKQCDVVYLDLEGSKSRISARTSQMTIPIPRNVHIANSIEKKLYDGLIDDLRKLHKQRPSIRLIIIDTYARAKGQPTKKKSGANAYEEDVLFLEPLQRMALDENISVLLITHDKKGAGYAADPLERTSGTMGINGSADCAMNLSHEGKRFEGKAILEVNPRDAVGRVIKLWFDNRSLEWQQIVDPAADLMGNPVCNWIVSNRPEARKEGSFFSYDFVYTQAYRACGDRPGEVIRDQIMQNRDELFSTFGIGVQVGVQSNGKRGIRIINLQ